MGMLSGAIGGIGEAAQGIAQGWIKNEQALDLEKERQNIEMEKIKAIAEMKRGMEKQFANEDRGEVVGLLQSARDKSNGVGGAGGYDPKAYNSLDDAGKAQFDRKTLVNAGRFDETKPFEYEINRRDKSASQEASNQLKQEMINMREKGLENTARYRDAELKLKEIGVGLREKALENAPKSSSKDIETQQLQQAYLSGEGAKYVTTDKSGKPRIDPSWIVGFKKWSKEQFGADSKDADVIRAATAIVNSSTDGISFEDAMAQARDALGKGEPNQKPKPQTKKPTLSNW